MKIFMFDIDGTLTPHRRPMTEDMVKFFLDFCKNNVVYLLTGSDWDKVQEQVPPEILACVKGTFTCSGNDYRDSKGTLIYEKSFYPNPHLDAFLQGILEASPYPTKTGRHIENRPGMVNFSIVGRDCTHEQREEYARWDNIHQERSMIRDKIMSSFTGLDVAVGGQISVDIYPKGSDKSQAYHIIKEANPQATILFFGDRLRHGGNDYPVYAAMVKSSHNFEGMPSRAPDFAYPVKDYKQTKETLEGFFRE